MPSMIVHIVSTLLLLYMSYRWSTDGGLNKFIKTLFIATTVANVILILMQLGFVVKV